MPRAKNATQKYEITDDALWFMKDAYENYWPISLPKMERGIISLYCNTAVVFLHKYLKWMKENNRIFDEGDFNDFYLSIIKGRSGISQLRNMYGRDVEVNSDKIAYRPNWGNRKRSRPTKTNNDIIEGEWVQSKEPERKQEDVQATGESSGSGNQTPGLAEGDVL
jgi:hypothetical protein